MDGIDNTYLPILNMNGFLALKPDDSNTLTSQARLVVSLVNDHGVITRDKLLELMAPHMKKQPASRVLSFYRKSIFDGGFVARVEAVPVTIGFPDDSAHMEKSTILRGFSVSGHEHPLLLLGTSASDNVLFWLREDSLAPVGALSPTAFDATVKSCESDTVTFDRDDFENLEDSPRFPLEATHYDKCENLAGALLKVPLPGGESTPAVTPVAAPTDIPVEPAQPAPVPAT